MRFIFNFIFFGILFYLIYLFLPEAFKTLVTWVEHIYVFLRDAVMQLTGKLDQMKAEDIHPTKELLQLAQSFFWK